MKCNNCGHEVKKTYGFTDDEIKTVGGNPYTKSTLPQQRLTAWNCFPISLEKLINLIPQCLPDGFYESHIVSPSPPHTTYVAEYDIEDDVWIVIMVSSNFDPEIGVVINTMFEIPAKKLKDK